MEQGGSQQPSVGYGELDASGGGELGAGEKINWVDSSVFIQGANNSITIDADDNFTLNTDTLVSINSTTKNQLTTPSS